MQAGGAHGNPFTAHGDLLNGDLPSEAAAASRWMAEVKNRAKGAVQAKMWPDAVALYKRALDLDPALFENASETAILRSNLALVLGKMNRWNESLESANQAVKSDPKYTKGWWRLSQARAALSNFDGAVEAIKKALETEPENGALKKEMDKLLQQQKDYNEKKRKEEEEAAKSGSAATASKTVKIETIPAGDDSSRKKSDAEPMDVEKVDGEAFSKSEHVKGYKIVNGKKTSYFHNELSEEAARLIGDIAPKKIDGPPSTSASEKSAPPGASAWNQAGTWEERDVSVWAQNSLQEKILQATYSLPASSPAPGALVIATKSKVSGNASVAAVRGKVRYIYELSVQVDWQFDHNNVTATGSMKFPDVDGTCALGEPYEASDFTIKDANDDTVRPLLQNFVYQSGFRDKLHEAIDDWVRHFKATYS